MRRAMNFAVLRTFESPFTRATERESVCPIGAVMTERRGVPLDADSTKTGQTCHSLTMPALAKSGTVSVSLVTVPEVSAAVVYGMHEVFTCVGTAWEILTGSQTNTRKMIPRIVGASTAPLRTSMGATLMAEHTFEEAHRSDIVIVADLNLAPGTDPNGKWPDVIEWLQDQHARGAIICSVCSGSLMLAEAGLLDGCEATTHWSVRPLFQQCYPKVLLRAERILVPSGTEHRIVTSGGSTSWTDLALYLVARFCGDAEARHIAKIFLFGDRSDGQLPFAAMVRPPQHDDATITRSQVWIADNYATTNPVAAMVHQSKLNDRTFKRRFKSATGYAPLEYVQSLRIEEAKQILETTEMAIDDVALAIGYEEPNSFRRLFKRTTDISPHQYRLRFAKVGMA
jgi:transcriptional regulator GlxA family with amidase domain